MPVVGPLVGAAAGIGGSLISSSATKNATNQAVAAQTAANQAAIAEQQRQFNTVQANYAPWLAGGRSALAEQLNLLGLGGGSGATAGTPSTAGTVNWTQYMQNNPDVMQAYQALSPRDRAQFPTPESYAQYHYQTYGQGEGRDVSGITSGGTAGTAGNNGLTGAQQQQASIDQLQASPLYQSLYRNGQETIMNNAAATGGLRGGNAQHSLANFGADTLAQVIQQQLANLQGVSNAGLQGTGAVSQAGSNSSNNVSNLLANNGQTQAGGILGANAANNAAINNISGSIGGLVNNSAFTNLFKGNSGGGGLASSGVLTQFPGANGMTGAISNRSGPF
jgi:hypothetical protein